MDEPKNLEEIYMMSRFENNHTFRAVQAHLQTKHPNKKMTVTLTMQYIVADSFASGELRNVEGRLLHSQPGGA